MLYLPAHLLLAALRLQIIFIEQGKIKKFIDPNSKPLTHFVDDPQLYRIIGTVDHISNGGFRHTAFHVKLILSHPALLQKLLQTLAECFIQFRANHRPCCCTIASIKTSAYKIVLVPVLSLKFVL